MKKVAMSLTLHVLPLDAEISASYATAVFHRGDIIRKWRTGKGWTAEQLADRAKLDRNVMTRVEKNQKVEEESLDRVARALGHTLAELHVLSEYYAALPGPSARTPDDVQARLSDPGTAERVRKFLALPDDVQEWMVERPYPGATRRDRESDPATTGGPHETATDTKPRSGLRR